MKNNIILFFSLFIFNFSFSQSWLWGDFGIGNAQVYSIASDGQGNCYLTGEFPNDTLHFGSYTLRNSTVTNAPYSSDLDAFLVKFDHSGNVLWAKQTTMKNSIDTLGNDGPYIVATDNKGNAYLNSNFPDTLFVGANMLTAIGYQSTCLAKFDPLGNVLWAKQSVCINNHSAASGIYTSCDNFGNIYVTGVFTDTVSFGSYIIGASSTLYSNAFLVKYDSSGNVKWVRNSPGLTVNSNDAGCSVANDRFGNAYITGAFADTVQFGSYQLISNNTVNFYLVKYDSGGNVLWAKQDTILSSNGGTQAWVLAVDPSENIYAAGDIDGIAVFDKDTLIAPSPGSFFLIKYAPNGNVIWVKQATVLDNNTWSVWGLSIDNYKHLYLSANGGYGQCKIVFGGDTLSMNDTARYDGASIIFKLDSNGKALCSSIIPAGTLGGVSNTMASDTSGNYVYFSAAASTPVIFGDDTIDPFLFPPNANYHGNFFPFVARWEACDSAAITASILTLKTNGQVIVYPNPNRGEFIIALQNVNEPAQVEIYDVLGEKIFKGILNTNTTQINIGSKAEGVYFYRVITENGGLVGSGKVVIEK